MAAIFQPTFNDSLMEANGKPVLSYAAARSMLMSDKLEETPFGYQWFLTKASENTVREYCSNLTYYKVHRFPLRKYLRSVDRRNDGRGQYGYICCEEVPDDDISDINY